MTLDAQRTETRFDLRYEDITQQGALRLDVVPVAIGAIWRALRLDEEITRELWAQGILPILSRTEVEAGEGPFSVQSPMEVRGGYTLSHGVDEAGVVNRLFFDMDAEVWGEKGRTNLEPPGDAGTRVLAGRIRAEHVFTRPFAGPGERRVVAIPTPEGPFVPKPQRIHRAPTEPLTLPPGAKALGDALRDDGTSLRFGASHTDSNQHVNSLVYPRLFEDAALRRFAALGKSTQVRASQAVLAYRKPSFQGDALRVLLQAFTAEDGSLGCTGAFVAEDDPSPERARVYLRMLFAAAD